MKKTLIYFKLVLILFCLCLVGCSSSNRVSEKEWDNAFKIENFTNFKMDCYEEIFDYSNDTSGITKSSVIYDDQKYFITIEDVNKEGESIGDIEQFYFCCVNNFWCKIIYSEENEQWFKVPYGFFNNYGMLIENINLFFTGKYNLFKYSKNKDCYLSINPIENYDYEISFKDGKLQKITMHNFKEIKVKIIFSGYNKQEVNLPQINA